MEIISYIWDCKGINHFLNLSYIVDMKQIIRIDCEGVKPYISPSLRVVPITTEFSFLQSNLEPIGGGDDPDIDW